MLIGDASSDVKLGCYYTHGNDFYYASQCQLKCPPACLVSTVASFGASGGAFTLRIDVSSLSPVAGHYIYLILWDDRNRNDQYDALEDWRYVIPLYDDAVFLNATDCVYYFDDQARPSVGTSPGWNQSVGLDRYVPIDRDEWNGARLANEVAWCGGATAARTAPEYAEPASRHARLL